VFAAALARVGGGDRRGFQPRFRADNPLREKEHPISAVRFPGLMVEGYGSRALDSGQKEIARRSTLRWKISPQEERFGHPVKWVVNKAAVMVSTAHSSRHHYRSQELPVLRKRAWWQDGGDALHAGTKRPAELRGRMAVLDRRAASDCGYCPWRHRRLGSPIAGSLAGRPSRAPAGTAGRRIS
jgi:hypothetical protein